MTSSSSVWGVNDCACGDFNARVGTSTLDEHNAIFWNIRRDILQSQDVNSNSEIHERVLHVRYVQHGILSEPCLYIHRKTRSTWDFSVLEKAFKTELDQLLMQWG